MMISYKIIIRKNKIWAKENKNDWIINKPMKTQTLVPLKSLVGEKLMRMMTRKTNSNKILLKNKLGLGPWKLKYKRTGRNMFLFLKVNLYSLIKILILQVLINHSLFYSQCIQNQLIFYKEI